ncbi:MAG: hypothetical protein AAB701_00105 [Patescibacteria group bacterium]
MRIILFAVTCLFIAMLTANLLHQPSGVGESIFVVLFGCGFAVTAIQMEPSIEATSKTHPLLAILLGFATGLIARYEVIHHD